MSAPAKADVTPKSMTDADSLDIEVSSEWLFKKAKSLVITHAGDRYFLRITRQNKLILTK